MHEAVQLWTLISLSFAPWIRKAHLEMGGNRKQVQESQQTNKYNLLYTAFMKMGLLDVSFNLSVTEENQKVKLIFLQLFHCSFPLIQTQ